MWNLEKDVGARSPFLHVLDRDTDLGYAPFKCCQGGVAKAEVIICEAQSPNEAVQDIQCDRDVYVDAGVQSGGWQMNHYCNDEPKEGNYVLDDKEFVREIPKRR